MIEVIGESFSMLFYERGRLIVGINRNSNSDDVHFTQLDNPIWQRLIRDSQNDNPNVGYLNSVIRVMPILFTNEYDVIHLINGFPSGQGRGFLFWGNVFDQLPNRISRFNMRQQLLITLVI